MILKINQFINEKKNIFFNFNFLDWSIKMSKQFNNSNHHLTFLYTKTYINIFNPKPIDDINLIQDWNVVKKIVHEHWNKFVKPSKANIKNKPTVYFHGSNVKNIKTFKINTNADYRIGVWFTDNPNVATKFINKKVSDTLDYGDMLYPAFLIMNNPLIVNAKNNYYLEIPTPTILKSYSNQPTVDTDLITEFAFKNDYDGVIINNVLEGPATEYSNVAVVFDNSQIKILK